MWKAMLVSTVAIFSAAEAAAAQVRSFDITYGRWWHGDGGAAEVMSASLSRQWFGPVSWGIGVNHLNDRQSFVDRSVTGGEVFLRLGAMRQGLYSIGAFGIGRRHNQSDLDAQWSMGVGYAYELFSFLRVTGEARYRVEDQQFQGFWGLDPADRRGLVLNAGLALRIGGTPRSPKPTRRPPSPVRRPPEAAPGPDDGPRAGRPALSTVARLPRTSAGLAADVAETALNVMGSPYEWGGSDANGFDCSGLIQYAYSQHGIIIPRVSRDQAGYGEYVEPKVENLRAGDILGFAITGGRVSHVGLYIGDGQFIHSSSTGVRLSNLTGTDGNSLYYQRRWVVARRVLSN